MKKKAGNNDFVSSPGVLHVSLHLKAWIGVLALPLHRYVTQRKLFPLPQDSVCSPVNWGDSTYFQGSRSN